MEGRVLCWTQNTFLSFGEDLGAEARLGGRPRSCSEGSEPLGALASPQRPAAGAPRLLAPPAAAPRWPSPSCGGSEGQLATAAPSSASHSPRPSGSEVSEAVYGSEASVAGAPRGDDEEDSLEDGFATDDEDLIGQSPSSSASRLPPTRTQAAAPAVPAPAIAYSLVPVLCPMGPVTFMQALPVEATVPPTGEGSATTLMLKNIGCRCTSKTLMQILDQNGLRGTYRSVYMPGRAAPPASAARRLPTNKGYAFVTFWDASGMELCKQLLDGKDVVFYNSSRRIEVAPAHLSGGHRCRGFRTAGARGAARGHR